MADLIVWLVDTDCAALVERISDGDVRRHFIRVLETGEEISPESLMEMDAFDENWPSQLPPDEAAYLLDEYEMLCWEDAG